MTGIDISHYQSGIDIKATGAQFAVMKATQGTSMVDSACDHLYSQARSIGIRRGVYHFYNGGDPTSEADYFLKNIQGYIGDALLALDWEDSATLGNVSAARAFLDRVYAETTVRPVIYMSQSVANGHDWTQVIQGNYGLWVARYASSVGAIGHWPGYIMWQNTDRFHGQSLDGDVFYGDASTWDKYAATHTTPAPAPVSTGIAVDGKWGSDTTRALQQHAGTTVDAVVSAQWNGYQGDNPGLTTGWEWVGNSAATGSQLVAWIQRQVGTEPDGRIGPDTISAMQRHYGTTVDGVVSLPSQMVTAMQNALNDGHF